LIVNGIIKIMKKTIINTYTALAILAIGAVSFLLLQAQNALVNLKQSVETNKNIRVAEKNSCTENDDSVSFSGCNSII